MASKTIAAVGDEAVLAGSSMTKFGASLESAGKSMKSVGDGMTRDITLPMAAVGGASIKMAMDFNQAMTYVRTDAGDTTDDINQLSQQVLQLARNSQFSPDELANGLYHLASLGLRGADAMNALNTAQKMAAVGGADLESTASALGAALVTGIKGVQDYNSAAGVLDATIGAGNMRMQDLVGALGTGVLTAFKNAGLSITEFGAALATLTDNGMGAEESATRLRMTIAMLVAPTGPAKDALEALGMTANQIGVELQTKGLVPALEDLKKHLEDTYGTTAEGKVKMQQALSDMFGGGRSSSAIETLLDQLDRVNSKESQIASQSGEFATKVAEQQQTAAAKFKTAWSSVQVDLIELGDRLLPVVADLLNKLVQKIDELSKWWDSLSSSQQKVIEKLGEFVFVAGPVLTILGKMFTGVGLLTKGLGLLIGEKGIAGVITSFAGRGGMIEATTEAAASSAGLAAILTGPMGLALAGVAVAGGIAYLAYNKLKQSIDGANISVNENNRSVTQFDTLAKNLGVQLQQTSGSVDMATLSHIHLQDAQKLVSSATQKVKSDTDAYKVSVDNLKASNDSVKQAQDNVKQALDQYGANSPQYRTATDNLATAQNNLANQMHDADANALNLTTHTGWLQGANQALSNAKATVFSWADYLNSKLSTGISLAGQLSNQMLGIGYASSSIQGAINNIQVAQSAAGILQQSMAQIQGGSFSLQGARASGGPVSSGGAYLVGEQGPEIFIPKNSGTILSNNQSQQAISGGTFNMYGNVNLGDASAVDRFFERLNAQKEMGALGVGI